MDGGSVGADRLSEGMLYWLAFAALPYLHPTPLILIEEPENGLHPSRIGDVMRVLREVAKTSQIILATHHPLVINELQADEVTIDAIGGVAKPAIEGWILALRAVPRTDEMSRARTLAHLAEHGIGIKSTADYVDIVEQAELGEPRHFGLPAGTESLRAWLATAHEVLTHLVHGRPAP